MSLSEPEWQAVSPNGLIRGVVEAAGQLREYKYAFQVGLKGLDFELDEDKAEALELTPFFQSVDQAEQALRQRVITPTTFLEKDDTEHQVMVFDPQPLAFSGFMNCVTDSLALTDQRLFEVGLYPAMDLASQHRCWQWFIHRRLARPEQIPALKEDHGLSEQQIVGAFFGCVSVRERRTER